MQGEGLTVLGVPSNDFGQQEPGTEADIRAFCSGTYGVTFPMTGKTVVRGGGGPSLLSLGAGRNWALRTRRAGTFTNIWSGAMAA
jgi:glutathione peroxidase-family protein